jgi:hypothetical protein
VIAVNKFLRGVLFDPGVERLAKARARDDGRRIGYLETCAEVAEVAATVPDAVWDDAIVWVLDHPGIGKEVTDALYAVWIAGDIDAVLSVTCRGLMRYDAIREAMVAARNSRWLPKVRALVASANEPTLILVGAAHLGGPEGLVAQLRAYGLTLASAEPTQRP